jgi:STE24 endopeptidase
MKGNALPLALPESLKLMVSALQAISHVVYIRRPDNMRDIYFCLIIGFCVYDFVSGQWLSYLNRTWMSPVMPKELEGIYDPAEYARQQMYEKENDRFGLISGGFGFAVIMTGLLYGWAGRLDAFLRGYTDHYIFPCSIYR